MGATLHLRHGTKTRDMPIEAFFLDYGKQDRSPGELVTGVTLPKAAPNLRCYKISKRFDQDISAVCGCFNVSVENGKVTDARIAFGGMAGIPHRAHQVETALIGSAWSAETVAEAASLFGEDYSPMSDMRASADYRLKVAQNLLRRYFAEMTGQATSVLEVTS